ncbi:RND family transporter [Mycolicibacter hiberniae]|uniref:Siderophore exporter MmpL4 n=1 Tax=Mycolicibacter hiberniae TaxID=29314 RepID=A0A7I7X8V8_9MYCO|nr:RND family transporter [Mycolicibacter hiberniae]MCV7085056.1 RND family transporter [Mycolicibacter hiberniae]BBZ25343.1 siderophore exporter MmpL4 [Mycolicibacter hiberniae]
MSGPETHGAGAQPHRPFIARTIRRFAIPIILGWLALIGVLVATVPPLEVVSKQNAVSASPADAPSMLAMTEMGRVFQESDYDSTAMIVLEADHELGDAEHAYYAELVDKLRADTAHVQHIQDFWGDPMTAVGAQSPDGRATYVQLNLVGNIGQSAANESIEAVRDIVDSVETPPGLTVYVTGTAALAADMNHAGDKSMFKMMAVTILVILTMLLLVYRSITTVVLLLGMVYMEMNAASGVVAFMGHHHWVGLTTFSVNLLVSLAIAAGTDYAIFLIGRYHEARQAGEDRESAYYTAFAGVAHVILGSGLTIAGAVFCLHFTRMPYFVTLGIPCAVGMTISVLAALTLGPAFITVGSRFGLFDPKRATSTRGWRRVATVIVRWPGPVLVASLAVAAVGLLTLPGYAPAYDDRKYIPADIPANEGFSAADRHFSQSRMLPEVLLIESDHDMRNPSDFLIIDKLAKSVFKVVGISRVQAITRPQGTPLEHTSIPFQISMQNAGQLQTMQFQKKRMDDMLTQAEAMAQTIATMRQMYGYMSQLAGTTHEMVGDMDVLQQQIYEIRDHIADFEDFWRPIRNYFYWEPHCYDIPICFSLRSAFDVVDSVDPMSDSMDKMIAHMGDMDALMPQMLTTFPPMIETMETMRTMMLTMHSTMSGIFEQMDEMSENATAMGKAFDESKNDDSFYLPPEVFENPDFKRAMNMFFSPDGKAVRMMISHRGNPATAEGISHIDKIRVAAEEALKGTPLEDAKIYLGGTASLFKDMHDGSNYDLLIAGIASLCLIFIIMLLITRALIAALVIVGTVALSLGASFGLAVLFWQYLIGVPLHWLVLVMSVIILLAVGSDYNLLLVSRFKEEMHAGLQTGIIRAMGGTGKVVTSAGLVFAFTMTSMAVSDLQIIGQIGTTIGLGLMFDTLIVRAFMTPSIAALLGRWFWWPINVLPHVGGKAARHRAVAARARGEDAETTENLANR